MAEQHVDVAVVGAGPAGLAAAAAAADAGLTVGLVDAGARVGGQYWRHREAAEPQGRGFVCARDALEGHLDAGRVEHLAGHHVWFAEQSGEVTRLHLARDGDAPVVSAGAVILATGTHDRLLPFPGWDLPGVMAAGGAQALLKGSGVVPPGRIVVAGTGPFLLPVAAALAAAGEVVEVVEAASLARWARHPLAVGRSRGKPVEAARYRTALARRRVPYRTRQAVVAAHGGGALEGVTIAAVDHDWRVLGGSLRDVECDVLAVGYGFTPQVELALALGCAAGLAADGSLVVAVDDHQRTTVTGVWAAGEVTGVGGADLAAVEGELAGVAVAGSFGRPLPRTGAQLGQLLAARDRLRGFATALHDVHRVRDGWRSWLDDSTLVCRCEEVPLARVREAVTELGATDARTVKLLARPGMGLCQGRICGWPVAALLAGMRDDPVDEADLLALSHRPIATPVPLGVLAEPALDKEKEGP